jgi:hypothetical protein
MTKTYRHKLSESEHLVSCQPADEQRHDDEQAAQGYMAVDSSLPPSKRQATKVAKTKLADE